LPSKEIEVLRTESITQMEDMKSDPQGLAFTEISRVFNQHDAADPRYSPSLDENIAWTKSVTAEEIQKVYAQLNGQHGELAIVGDFDAEETLPALEAVFANWTSEQAYERVPDPANTSVAGRRITINTPDKANAVYIAGQPLLMNDADPDYEAMLVGNYILGGGPLASRLADRVRKQEGLSYGVGSMFNADSVDQNAILIMFAISNPDNTEKVVNTITEEVERLLASGVENDELEKAKASYLETRKGGRSNDGQLASALVTNLETGRTMDFQESTDAKIELLTKEKVDSVLKKLVDPKQTVIVTAGDFEKAKQAESNSESKTDDKE
jgi:zinc protease